MQTKWVFTPVENPVANPAILSIYTMTEYYCPATLCIFVSRMRGHIVILFILLALSKASYTQEPIYFNNIYNPENTYANGRGILQIDGYYYGIFGTWTPPDYYYQLGVFKMSSTGELLDYNLFGEEEHDYFVGRVGGTLIKTSDGNLAFISQVQNSQTVFGTLVKLNLNLDTLWQQKYYTEYFWTMIERVIPLSDGGFVLVGQVVPEDGLFYDALLLKTDSLGNEMWHQTYGGTWEEYGTDIIELQNGGYLIGGMFRKPGWDHSLDAMVIKTDSLGNEEWTNYYGNPAVNDDKAFVMAAEDGNYLVATVYGGTILSSYRVGRPWFLKLDNSGIIIDEYFYGPHRMNSFIMNTRKVKDGFVTSGFSYETDSSTSALYTGWLMKINNNMDSVWYHDYMHFDELYDDNFLYDVYPTTDNGYITIGKARPDQPGQTNKMWIIKVDSMGCDTPGCATGTQVFELPLEWNNQVKVYPNPANNYLIVELMTGNLNGFDLTLYDNQGRAIKTMKVPGRQQHHVVSIDGLETGIYFLRVEQNGKTLETVKFSKIH